MKPFGELSNEEKKALLCAWVDGAVIEMLRANGEWCLATPSWDNSICYRVAPAVMPSIDWTHVAPHFMWLAVDESGGAFIYPRKPNIGAKEWNHGSGDWRRVDNLFASYERGTVRWQDCLVARPEEEKQQC